MALKKPINWGCDEMTTRLEGAARVKAVQELDNWANVDGRDAIHKTFRFKNFREAWGFMSEMALVAEKIDHHPEWTNVYGRVDVTLTTHSANGLSELDIALARKMDEAAKG
jgi:4a-hydroxytetrahydrobiopterin dehydratase